MSTVMAQGPEGEDKASLQTLKKLFFPVLHLPLGAFYLSHPNPCVYVTELSKPVYKAFPQLFQSTFSTLQNTISLHFNWPLTQWKQRTNTKPLFPA